MHPRIATKQDYPGILKLIQELALFEKAPEKVSNSVEQMLEEDHLFEAFVIEDRQGEIIAMALYFFAYYTWVGKSLYLDDLYVKKEYRGNGYGKALLKKIFEVAKDSDCKRVRWQVLDWNSPAIVFYKKCKSNLDEEWINCDFDRKGIEDFN